MTVTWPSHFQTLSEWRGKRLTSQKRHQNISKEEDVENGVCPERGNLVADAVQPVEGHHGRSQQRSVKETHCHENQPRNAEWRQREDHS